MNGVEITEEKEIEMTILLQETYSKQFVLEIVKNMNDLIFSEVSEDQGFYELTFSGTSDEFISVVYVGTIDMLQTIGKEIPTELEVVLNVYKIIIE